MFKKILIISILGIILLGATTHALTFKEFFQKPLPNVVEFAEKAIDWFAWLCSKIIFYAVIVLNWTLDVALVKTWKFFVWLWLLIKTAMATGWDLIDQLARGLATSSGIDWRNIRWPWSN